MWLTDLRKNAYLLAHYKEYYKGWRWRSGWGNIRRTKADSFHDLSQGTNLWRSADPHLLSEPCLLGFGGHLIVFLNDDSHVERYWAGVQSEANRLTLRKPSQAGCPVSSVPLCRIHSLGMEQVVFLVCLFFSLWASITQEMSEDVLMALSNGGRSQFECLLSILRKRNWYLRLGR